MVSERGSRCAACWSASASLVASGDRVPPRVSNAGSVVPRAAGEQRAHSEEGMASMDAKWEFQDRMATAFDEIGVLVEMGQDGWELTGQGPFVLHFRRPVDPAQRVAWSHQRVTELGTPGRHQQLQQDGWTYCGHWMKTFHYYKRAERGGA